MSQLSLVPGLAQLGDVRGSSGAAVTSVKAISPGLKVAVLLVMSAWGTALGCVSPDASPSDTLVTLAPPAGDDSAATARSEVTAQAMRHRRGRVIGSSGALRATRGWVRR